MRIGIPRSLSYYTYFPMWKTFFEELDAQVILSPPSSKHIIEAGCSRLNSEICLPVRVFCGHVASLSGKCDYVFVPAIWSINHNIYNCPKFIGLPDLVRTAVPESPPLLAPDIDVNRRKLDLVLAVYRLGQTFCRNPLRIRKAAEKALAIHQKYLSGMHIHKREIPQAICEMGLSEKIEESFSDISRLKLAVIGHPYMIHDEYINHRLLAKLKRVASIRLPEMVARTDSLKSIARVSEKPYWTCEDDVVGAGGHYLNDGCDGIICVTAFGCGPDSLMVELVRHQAKELNKPFLNLVLDEHTAETGLDTRLEAFVDMINRKGKPENKPHYYPAPAETSLQAINVLGIHSYANVVRAVRTVGKMLKVPIVAPPITRNTLTLGARHSPEFVCIPFKLILGNYIEALEQGADTLIMVTSNNACRLGYYVRVQEQILRDMGYNFQFFKLTSSDSGVLGIYRVIRRLTNNASLSTIISAYRLGVFKIRAIDNIEREAQKCRPLELERGASDRIYRQALGEIEEAEDLTLLKKLFNHYMLQLKGIPKDNHYIPLKVGIVGEIYAVMEPFVNMNIEMLLGSMGVQVRRTRSTFLSEYLRIGKGNVLGDEKESLRKFAEPYLMRDVGGHGLESVGEKVRLGREGYDGIIHLAPFTCMPEAIAQNVMQSTGVDIPVLTILCDEQLGMAGMQTRLEAFIDLLKWRRRSGKRVNERYRSRGNGS